MDNTSKGAEIIILLELIEVIGSKGKHITFRKIQIGFDNRTSHKKITQALSKPSKYTQDSGAAIARIKKIMKEAPFEIELVLVKGHVIPRRPYQQQPLQHLIIECDRKAKKTREEIQTFPSITNIKYTGDYAIF